MKKKLITGLGNPGEKYKKTRHNAGFFVVDELERLFNSSEVANFSSRFESENDQRRALKGASMRVLWLKPQTGMNSSGKAVKREVEKRGINLSSLLVVHDDMDIELGEYKLQKAKGAAGHNGVQSVIDFLGSKDFWRLRIGIGRPLESVDPAEYVLEDFTKNELRILGGLIEDELIPIIMEWLSDE